MSEIKENQGNSDLSDNESDCEAEEENRRTHVGAWKDKSEFDRVFNQIYGPEANNETKAEACNTMIIWKLRRLELTPAAVLSTLVILEVQLKDNENIEDEERLKELRILYSSAFTRFLNYMSSIARSKQLKTMYETAKELGIDSFLVDLRHLCAHGQVMPDLDVFRRTAVYCINWLNGFYWTPHKNSIRNVDAKHVRREEITKFDENIRELFQIYDTILECLLKGCIKVTEGSNILSDETYGMLKKFSNENEETEIEQLLAVSVKNIWNLVRRDERLKDLAHIYIDAFIEMKSFFQFAADLKTTKDGGDLVALNQPLFRTIAIYGFIEDLFYKLLEICENEFEIAFRRKGASFWAYQIAHGFNIFQMFRSKYKHKKEEEPDIQLDLTTINTNTMAKNVRKIYRDMNVDVKKTLIFGDTFRRPFSLCLERDYIEERILNINEYTVQVLKLCLLLVDPKLSEDEYNQLNALINLYFDNACSDVENIDDNNVYTLQKDVLKNSDEVNVEMTVEEETKFGIWTLVQDGQDWHTCPLGRHIWE